MRFHLCLLFYQVYCTISSADNDVFIVSSIEGEQARLPCDIHSRKNDSVYLVLWYRKDSGTPIYSYDSRPGGGLQDRSLWSEPKAFGSRAYYHINSNPSMLAVSDLKGVDSGTYTCRVDYTQSPTVYHHVRLDVTVPPVTLMIIGDRGREITDNNPIGPFKEGDPFTVLCVATGGEPPPSVLWYMDDQLIDKTYIANEKGAVQNTLTIQRLSRANMGPLYHCIASNNNISKPLMKTISIDIMFPPLGVRILSEDSPLVAGKEYSLGCISWGSLPAADISWYRKPSAYMGIIPLPVESSSVSSDGNITETWIRYIPSPEHHRQTITCRASNYKLMSGNSIEDHRTLDVFFAPRVELKLGPAVNPKDLEEGDDLYFECHVKAHPPVYKIVWKYNGRELYPGQDQGRIVFNQSLVIQKVRKEDSGNYSCQAYNVEGQQESVPEVLDVMYAPRCVSTQKMIYGVSEGETAYISCMIDAKPKPDQILWYMNTTSGNRIIPGAMSTNMAGASLLSYRPTTQMDFGTILCFGVNLVGRQHQPCVFHLIPAGVPEKPDYCHIANKTSSALRIVCDAGFNGGLQQSFHLEVMDFSNSQLLANITQDLPSFWVEGLPPSQAVYIRIYASNLKGRSKAEMIRSQTSAYDGVGFPLQNDKDGDDDSFSLLIVLIFVSVILFSLTGIVISVVLRCLASPSPVCTQGTSLQQSINFQFQSTGGTNDSYSQSREREKPGQSDIYHQRRSMRGKDDTTSLCSSDSSGFSEINNSDSDKQLVYRNLRESTQDHKLFSPQELHRSPYPAEVRTLGRGRSSLNQYKYCSLQRNSERSRVTASGRSSMHFPDNLFLDKPFQDNSFQNNVLPNNMFPEELFQTKPIPDKSFKGNENFELDIRNDIFDQKTDSLKYDSDRESCV